MVGTTTAECGKGMELLEKACTFVKAGGSVYYQSLNEKEDCNAVMQTAFRCGMSLAAFAEDHAYGFHACYYKFEKRT